jgi:hypothetical protein
MNKLIVSVIAVAVVVGGGSFYGGMKYAENKAVSDRQQRIQQFGGSGMGFRNGGSGNRTAGGFASGEILSKDDKSITIKMRDGGSKIIFFSDTTEIGKFVNGTSSDLEVGKNVSINGTANSDGSITAQSIQLRPAITPNQ